MGGVGLTNTHVWFWAQPDASYACKTINPNATPPAPLPGLPGSFPISSSSSGATSVPSPPPRKQGGNKRKQFDRKRLGWLQSTTRIHTWPPGLKRICPRFAFVNSECTGNCNKEHLYWIKLTEKEQETAKAWVASTSGLEFNTDQNTGGTTATPRHMRNN